MQNSKKKMTYKELLEKLSELNEEQLSCHVTVFDVLWDEFFHASKLDCNLDTDVLDENHPVLVFNADVDFESEKDE